MTMQFEPYWLSLKDELPAIGCGFRHVWAQVGKKWVKVKHMADDAQASSRVHITRWNRVRKLPDTGQPFSDIMVGLSRR